MSSKEHKNITERWEITFKKVNMTKNWWTEEEERQPTGCVVLPLCSTCLFALGPVKDSLPHLWPYCTLLKKLTSVALHRVRARTAESVVSKHLNPACPLNPLTSNPWPSRISLWSCLPDHPGGSVRRQTDSQRVLGAAEGRRADSGCFLQATSRLFFVRSAPSGEFAQYLSGRAPDWRLDSGRRTLRCQADVECGTAALVMSGGQRLFTREDFVFPALSPKWVWNLCFSVMWERTAGDWTNGMLAALLLLHGLAVDDSAATDMQTCRVVR